MLWDTSILINHSDALAMFSYVIAGFKCIDTSVTAANAVPSMESIIQFVYHNFHFSQIYRR